MPKGSVSKRNVIRDLARSWLIDWGEAPSVVEDMSPRQLRRTMDTVFAPTGWRGFKNYVDYKARTDLVQDLVTTPTTASSQVELPGDGGTYETYLAPPIVDRQEPRRALTTGSSKAVVPATASG